MIYSIKLDTTAPKISAEENFSLVSWCFEPSQPPGVTSWLLQRRKTDGLQHKDGHQLSQDFCREEKHMTHSITLHTNTTRMSAHYKVRWPTA